MKAMVLAAGVGSRLRPLSNTTPKALVQIEGVPMIEQVLIRLINAGVSEVIINLHHHAEKISAFIASKKNFGIRIEFSHEQELLDTGGGLKKAAPFFDDGKPFFLHNVDVLTDIDLRDLYRSHIEDPSLATLAVQARRSSRLLLFDREGLLCGWRSLAQNQLQWSLRPVPDAEGLAFTGIHVISPELFTKMTEKGVFSINQTYLRLAGRGERIRAYRVDKAFWRDVGSVEKLEQARRDLKKKNLEKRV